MSPARLGLAVQARLADDRVDADGRLAGRAVADDQLALAAADRDHRVDRHDAGLHRLADRPAPHDPRRDLLDRIGDVARDRSLAVDRFAEHVDDASEQPFADRHLQQLAGGADLAAFLQDRVVAENDDADFGLLEAQRQAGDAVAEIEHLVQHDVAEALDAGDAVADLANDADVLLDGGGLGAGDLRFDVLNQVGHACHLTALRETGAQKRASSAARPALTAAVVDVAPDGDAHAADERRVLREGGDDPRAIHARDARFDARADVRRATARRSSTSALCFARDRAAPGAESATGRGSVPGRAASTSRSHDARARGPRRAIRSPGTAGTAAWLRAALASTVFMPARPARYEGRQLPWPFLPPGGADRPASAPCR